MAGEETKVKLPAGIVGALMGEVERDRRPGRAAAAAPEQGSRRHRQADAAHRWPPQGHGRRALHGRRAAPGHAPRARRALAARARAHPRHRHERRRARDGRARRARPRSIRGGIARLRDPSQEETLNDGGSAPKPPPRALRFPIVRYVGQPILAIAADTQEAADAAARLVRIDYEVLPFVVDLEAAREPGAPLVFPGPADSRRQRRRRGRGRGRAADGQRPRAQQERHARSAARRRRGRLRAGRGHRRRHVPHAGPDALADGDARRRRRLARRTASPSTPPRRAPPRCATSWPRSSSCRRARSAW